MNPGNGSDRGKGIRQPTDVAWGDGQAILDSTVRGSVAVDARHRGRALLALFAYLEVGAVVLWHASDLTTSLPEMAVVLPVAAAIVAGVTAARIERILPSVAAMSAGALLAKLMHDWPSDMGMSPTITHANGSSRSRAPWRPSGF